jgi:hypothetical protein
MPFPNIGITFTAKQLFSISKPVPKVTGCCIVNTIALITNEDRHLKNTSTYQNEHFVKKSGKIPAPLF